MRKSERLKSEARAAATWHGHKLGRFYPVTPYGPDRPVFHAACARCGAYVQVMTRPHPNGIEVSGPAVAIGCK